MRISRCWAMPSPNTFSIPPIAAFISRYLTTGVVSADPFARNSTLATYRNDLNPATVAPSHLDAEEFLVTLGQPIDVLLFDPPYSPRQISECYQQVGRAVGVEGTQNAALYKRVRDAAMPLFRPGAVVLSFGWNSAGMGTGRGFEIEEILLVAHGGAHNDTICVAERKQVRPFKRALLDLLVTAPSARQEDA